MNVTSDDALAEIASKAFEERSLEYTGGDYENETFKYRLLKLATIEPDMKYPVVLFLHGAGERGADNKNQLKYFPAMMATDNAREKFPSFVVAPQCRTGKSWATLDWSSKKSIPMEQPTDQLQVAINALQEVIKEFPVDEKRVYLTGLSMGGYGSWDLASRHPKWFAAVVPICGGGDETQAAKLRDLPIWAYHGDKDNAVPVEHSRRMIEAIKQAGGSPRYTELPGVEHDSWSSAYTDTKGPVPWMFEQQRD